MTDKPEMKLVPVEPTDEICKNGSAKVRDFYSESNPYSRTKAMYKAITKDAPTVQEVDLSDIESVASPAVTTKPFVNFSGSSLLMPLIAMLIGLSIADMV